jgi:hypothetical protein
MSLFAELKDDALRFITGYELKNGRGPTHAEVADAVCDGKDGLAEQLICSLCIEGKLRCAPRSRTRRLQALQPVAVPRAPDGEPLHAVRIRGLVA